MKLWPKSVSFYVHYTALLADGSRILITGKFHSISFEPPPLHYACQQRHPIPNVYVIPKDRTEQKIVAMLTPMLVNNMS